MSLQSWRGCVRGLNIFSPFFLERIFRVLLCMENDKESMQSMN